MGAFLAIAYWVGVIASFFVLYPRAGFAAVRAETGVDWREFLLPNLPFFVLYLIKVVVWPIPLIAWLVTGRPPSHWTAVTRDGSREIRAVVRVK